MLQQTDTILQLDTSQHYDQVSNSVVTDSLQKSSDTLTFTEKPYENLPREEGIPIFHYQNNTLFGMCLAIFIFFTIIRVLFKNYLHLIINASQNYQTANTLFLEKNMINLRGSILLNIFFFINISFFLFEYYSFLYIDNFKDISLIIYLQILIVVLGVYFVKMIILFLLGFIFEGMSEAREYLNTVFVYNKNTAIFLLPITLSIPFISLDFKPFLFYIGGGIMLILFIYRLFRGFKILFQKHVSIFYMILYLCALEILPMLVILKILKSLA